MSAQSTLGLTDFEARTFRCLLIVPGQLLKPWKSEMERENTFRPDGEFKGGVLAHLERLETQLNKSHKRLEGLQRAQAEESALESKIHKLTCLRDQLRAEMQQRRARSDFAAFLAGPLQRNSLYNLLSFTYNVELRGQSLPFCARLLYKDLTTTLPTDVTVTYQGMDTLSTSWEEQRASHENLFCTKPLHQVFTSFTRKGEKLGMSLAS